MKIHVVAVAGTGMGSLAGLLASMGHDVSGSDVAFDPPMGPALEGWGVRSMHGFDAAHLDPEPELVIIGNVCRRDNPEARRAIDGGLRYTHIAGALRDLVLDGTSPLVVAGTHGKTTTTALCAFALDAAGAAPGFLIGGIPKNFDTSFRAARRGLPTARAGRRTPFVIEGDEYDTAFFEKTAKFLHYRAEVAIVTSIEHDHVDIYPTEESYVEAFSAFVRGVPESGLVVACASDPRVVDVVDREARANVAWYAVEGDRAHRPPHWLVAPADSDARGTRFDLFAGGVLCGRYASSLHGRHNLANAAAAIGACCQGFGMSVPAIAGSLARFEGVKRRLDLIGTPRDVSVYDDFAHHPTAVRETLRALRLRHATGRIFAVFEARSATACRAMHQAEYTLAFDAADVVILAPLGRDLAPEERLDTGRLASDLRASGKSAQALPSVAAIIAALTRDAGPGDVIALLSNGAFGGIHGILVAALSGASS